MAQLDPSIILGAKPVEVPNVLASYAQLLQAQGLQAHNALAGLNMQKAQSELADQGIIRNALTGLPATATNDQRVAALYGTGTPTGLKLGGEIAKSASDEKLKSAQAGKATADTQKTELETTYAKIKHLGDLASGVRDEPSYQQFLTTAKLIGAKTDDAPPNYDPNYIAQKVQGALTYAQKLEQDIKQATLAETGRHHKATEGLTARGQDLTNARARDSAAATMSKPFEVTGPDGTPTLVQQDKAGNITPVAGYSPKGSSKPLPNAVVKQLTEARQNAATIDRLTSSFKDDFAGKGILGIGAEASLGGKAILGRDTDAVDWWKNYRKQAELIERHALFGAALTPGEQASWRSADISPGMDAKVIKRNLDTRAALSRKVFENTQQDLIDAGHSPERINAIAGRDTAIPQTAQQREQEFQNNLAERASLPGLPPQARAAAQAELDRTRAKPSAAPKVGAIEQGHRFKGGDPANPANWEKL